MIGFTLVLGGFNTRLWASILAVTGVFYGLFGALRLGVTIDLALLAGALLLLVLVFMSRTHAPRQSLAH